MKVRVGMTLGIMLAMALGQVRSNKPDGCEAWWGLPTPPKTHKTTTSVQSNGGCPETGQCGTSTRHPMCLHRLRARIGGPD